MDGRDIGQHVGASDEGAAKLKKTFPGECAWDGILIGNRLKRKIKS